MPVSQPSITIKKYFKKELDPFFVNTCNYGTFKQFPLKYPFNQNQCKERRVMLGYLLSVVSLKPPANRANKLETVIVNHSQQLSLIYTANDRKPLSNRMFNVSLARTSIKAFLCISYVFCVKCMYNESKIILQQLIYEMS